MFNVIEYVFHTLTVNCHFFFYFCLYVAYQYFKFHSDKYSCTLLYVFLDPGLQPVQNFYCNPIPILYVYTRERNKNIMEKFNISKAKSKEDYDNGCLQPTDGGQYDVEDAIKILENGNGGVISGVESYHNYMVDYDAAKNDWIMKSITKN